MKTSKTLSFLSFCAACLFGAVAPLSARQGDAAKKAAAGLHDAFSKAEKSFRSNFPGSGIVYTTKGIEDALKIYQDALSVPNLNNTQKIEIRKRIANCLLELMNVKDANTILAEASVLPGLTAEEKFRAQWNQMDAFRRELNFSKAIPLCRELLKYGKINRNDKRKITGILIRNTVQEKGLAAAEKIFAGDPEARLQVAWLFPEQSDAFFEKLFFSKEAGITDDNRFHALKFMLSNAAQNMDLPRLRKICVWADHFLKTHRMRNLYERAFNGWTLRNIRNNSAVMTFCMKKRLAYNHADVEATEILTGCMIKDGRLDLALDTVNTILKQEKIPAGKRKFFSEIQAVLSAKNPKDAVNALLAIPEGNDAGRQRPPAEKASLLQRAGQFAMKCGKENFAKAFWNEREALLVQEEKRTLPCVFMENGPQNIAEFLTDPVILDPARAGVLDRKYGENLQFLLETDSALTGRTVTKDDGKALQPTRFTASCNETGVQFFFLMHCDPERAKNLKLGYGSFGGFEAYLATGFDQPYYCFLISCPPQEKVEDFFFTQYDNQHFRRAMVKKGNLRVSFQISKDQVLMLLEIDWLAVMNGIPKNGDIWEFDAIHWERGGYSWGGSKSVHNRSSFGNLVFANMTEKNRTKIKRRLLAYAQKTYKKELSNWNGCLENWLDPELGDPVFEAEVIAPFRAEFGTLVDAIKPDMTDTEVNRIFDKAYSTLINTRFVVQELRKNYLTKKLTEE